MPGSFQIGFKYDSDGKSVLQAPAPPSGIIRSEQVQQPNSATYSSYTTSNNKNNPQPVRSLSPTKAHNQHQEDHHRFSRKYSASGRRQSTGSYFADLPKMVCFCLCCPVYKCVLWGCLMELLVSIVCWYKILNLLVQTLDAVQIKDVFLILFLTFWMVTLFTSTGMLMTAHRRKNASYVLPRMIQQIGLLISSLGLLLLLFCYFTGAGTTINNWVIWAYELFLEYDLTPEDEREMARQLHTIALVTILFNIMFICYVSCGLCMTKKYYDKMKKKYGSGFHPVSQNEQEPTAPQQPAINPYYKV